MSVDIDGTVVTNIADLATAAADPCEVEPGHLYVVMGPDGPVTLDYTGDKYRDAPQRMTGTTTVRDVASLVALWRKYGADDISEVYADRDRLTVTVVFDAHNPAVDAPGWCQHRAILQLKHSSAWTAWKGADGREMSQAAFAEHLEDNRADISRPTAAEMLEVAQSIQAVSKVDFASGFRLVDGQRRLTYTETIESKAGQRGELAIPAEIVLRLPVFNGATVGDELVARFRHRIADGQLRLSYRLDRPDDVVDAAFAGVVAEVAEQCATTVLMGTPA